MGAYSGMPWGGETAVVRWDGGLAMMGLPTSDPAEALQELRHVSGDTFRRVRDDGELGESVIFVRGEDGDVSGMQRHRSFWERIR